MSVHINSMTRLFGLSTCGQWAIEVLHTISFWNKLQNGPEFPGFPEYPLRSDLRPASKRKLELRDFRFPTPFFEIGTVSATTSDRATG